MTRAINPLIPAQAGIQEILRWVPAFAGTSGIRDVRFLLEACAESELIILLDNRPEIRKPQNEVEGQQKPDDAECYDRQQIG